MSQKQQNDLKIIQDFLRSLKEEDLYEPLRSLFVAQGYSAWIVHGSHERGKDIIASKENDHNILISAKKGDIDQRRWKTEVHPGLDELMKRRIQHTNVNDALPRKPLLVLNGVLLGSVDQMIVEFNDYYRNHNEPELEVWDINKLSQEFYNHLLSIDLVGGEFLEDLQRVVLSITASEIDSKYLQSFVDKHASVDKGKFLAFRLAMLYVLRRAENQQNVYSFFKFVEYSLIKIWQIYHSKNINSTQQFDDLHSIYLDSLEQWAKSMKETFQKESGLFDFSRNGTLEIITYPLRTFDTIRRLSYLIYFYVINEDQNKVKEYSESLLQVITNNKVSSSPLCEFNYTDIGMGLTALILAKRHIEARMWLFDLTDFLVSHYSMGYDVLPLGKELGEVFDHVVFKEKPLLRSESESILFPLLLEFAMILNASEIFAIFSTRIRNLVRCYEIIMPAEMEESEIYQRKIVNSTYRPIIIPFSWFRFKKNFSAQAQNSRRNYSSICKSRPFLLVLVSNHFRDRYFPDIWRHLFSKY